jgi:hypothetical protein
MAGMTDYSHQSFNDMLTDLDNWLKNLVQVCELLEENEAQLKLDDYYWGNINHDVQGIFLYSHKFFKTSIEEIESILADLEDEIQENHVSRIRSLGLTAKNLETDLAITWHQDPWEYQKDYENSKFRLAEKMYTEARGMAADMIDLLNLAVRLEDFLGKKGKSAKNSGSNKASPDTHLFVAQTRLNDLRTIKSTDFDLAKLIRLCDELNICYINECYFATAMIGRAILDHVPPIFGYTKFTEVCNNYKAPKSFKESIKTLEDSLRHIADHHLHVQVRNKESLPSRAQVSFSANLDVLLGEIVRILK